MPDHHSHALSVIVTDFNGYAQTRRCLEALRASHFRDFDVLVVDHGTTDETRAGLTAEFPDVVRVAGSPEVWWTGATNLGIRCALDRGAEWIMLLNNDCYVTPEAIGTLVGHSRAHPHAIVAPVQRDWQSGRVTCVSLRSLFLLGFPTVPGLRRLTPALLRRELLTVGLIGGGRGVIIPAPLFERLGLFDEFPLVAAERNRPLELGRQLPLQFRQHQLRRLPHAKRPLQHLDQLFLG